MMEAAKWCHFVGKGKAKLLLDSYHVPCELLCASVHCYLILVLIRVL